MTLVIFPRVPTVSVETTDLHGRPCDAASVLQVLKGAICLCTYTLIQVEHDPSFLRLCNYFLLEDVILITRAVTRNLYTYATCPSSHYDSLEFRKEVQTFIHQARFPMFLMNEIVQELFDMFREMIPPRDTAHRLMGELLELQNQGGEWVDECIGRVLERTRTEENKSAC